jgi:hypothetical protein
MTKIMRNRPITPAKLVTNTGTLNGAQRRKNMVRITRENFAILRRLRDSKPSYDVTEWERERRERERQLQHMGEYEYCLSTSRSRSRSRSRSSSALNTRRIQTRA